SASVAVGTTNTDATGYYRFDDSNVAGNNLAPGNYTIVQSLIPAGYGVGDTDLSDDLDSPTATVFGGQPAIAVTVQDPTLWVDHYVENGFSESVTISYTGFGTATGNAAQFHIQLTNGAFANPASTPPYLFSFCTDLNSDVATPSTFPFLPAPITAPNV